MPLGIDAIGLRKLLADGATLIEVLPEDEFREEHLPNAVSIPLKALDADSTAGLDKQRPVIVYCWDSICDLSPRAACRLETLGFRNVHDYAVGKADWLTRGLPTEGERAPGLRAKDVVETDVVTCALDDPVGDVRERVARSRYPIALVGDARRHRDRLHDAPRR
jgi:rhodanese-related sulfurtransferase